MIPFGRKNWLIDRIVYHSQNSNMPSYHAKKACSCLVPENLVEIKKIPSQISL
jgi:hypothetical protein